MAEPTPTDSNTATAAHVNPSHHSSKESRIVAAGSKDHAVVSSAEKISQAEKMQPRILPLLGKPYFACVMCKSHVQPPFQVVVPRSLASFLPTKTAPATLTWQGRSWGMRFTGGRLIQRLEAGWRGFVLDNALRLGDGCVFELVDGESVAFRMQVLRAEIPARIRERAGGYTPSSPIVMEKKNSYKTRSNLSSG